MENKINVLGIKFNYQTSAQKREKAVQRQIEIEKQVANNVLELVDEINNKQQQKKVLKDNLALIEIETFSFCNRQCYFCPNSFIDRHSQNHYMDEKIYLKILDELAEIDYSGIVTYSRYNEPFADRIILERLRQARKRLPNANLYSHTNGDYLTKEYLDEIADAGLNTMKLQCYLGKNEEFSRDIILPKMDKYAKKLGLGYKIIADSEQEIAVKLDFDKIDIVYQAYNFKSVGNNRGDSLELVAKTERKEACYMPFTNIYIDYNGKVMPCCNFRSDIAKHECLSLGSVEDSSLAELFTCKKIADFRRSLGYYGDKPVPCNTCSSWKNVYVDFKNKE